MDAAHEGFADFAQRDKFKQILRRDGNVGDLPRNGCAGRNGDTCVGLRQGRRIVYAVANHDNRAARGLFPADERRLVLGQNLGVEFVNADLFRDGRGGPAIIAGHHDDLADAAGVQRTDGILCLGAQRVVNTDDGCKFTRNAQIQVRILCGQGIEFLLFALRDGAALVLKDEVCAADEHLFALDHAGNAVRDDVLHLRMIFLMLEALLFGLLHNGVGHRMRVMLLKAGSQTQHFRLLMTAEGHNLCNLRLGVGQCPGLVEHDRIRLRHSLQKPSALDRNVIAAALAHGREHRDGHGQLQRA